MKNKITPAYLKDIYDRTLKSYTKVHRKMKALHESDSGELWDTLSKKFPAYQIKPETNFVTYVKDNILASIYTVAKCADVMPTSDKDKDITMHFNIALEQIWSLSNVGYYQFLAGERASLLNLGITQVGWDDTLSGGSGDYAYKGNVALKNIDPMKFMRDPFSENLDDAAYCITYDQFHKSVLLRNPNYTEKFKEYIEKKKAQDIMRVPSLKEEKPDGNTDDYYTLVIFWIKHKDGISEYHTVNCEEILYEVEKIEPDCYPFALLYCNPAANKLVGVSSPAKIFRSSIAYNIMDSIALTAEYKNQRPPKFISSASGLNVGAFAKHGDDANKTFVVHGDASRAVHYQQYPQISGFIANLKQSLEQGISTVSGVDGRYTGRDTGSIITTGGTEEMLNRVTMIDTPKIVNYEYYTKELTKLILANMIQYSPKRKYFYREPNSTKWKTQEVDFEKVDKATIFNYQINISSELPKNRQRLANMANMLMEKQMQYRQEGGGSVELLTEEEWLMFQDLPNKEYMLERMGIQRQQDAIEDVSQMLFQYAGLVEQGMDPNDAMMMTAETLQNKRSGMPMTPETAPMTTSMESEAQINPMQGINPLQ